MNMGIANRGGAFSIPLAIVGDVSEANICAVHDDGTACVVDLPHVVGVEIDVRSVRTAAIAYVGIIEFEGTSLCNVYLPPVTRSGDGGGAVVARVPADVVVLGGEHCAIRGVECTSDNASSNEDIDVTVAARLAQFDHRARLDGEGDSLRYKKCVDEIRTA